ncbi:MAG: aminotransferase class IV [Polyangiaceae bacterium]|nr:aminotransferase class IV [Polyangiaceae bacterium]
MKSVVVIDGRLVADDQACVSVFDRGFLYGDSVFEAIATRGGRPVDLQAHLARLVRSAEQVHIPMPVPWTRIAAEVDMALSTSGNAESNIRVMLTRGQGALGLDPSSAHSPLRVIIVTPLQRPPREFYEQGIGVSTYRTQRTADATDAVGAKVGNYLVAVLGMHAARAQGSEEALVLDGKGHVVEGATSNVFAVRGGVLVTPPVEAGILPGITRARLLEIARAQGIACEEKTLTVAEFLAADEVFISSSIREVVPVVRIDGTPVGGGQPGPIARRLLTAYQQWAENKA